MRHLGVVALWLLLSATLAVAGNVYYPEPNCRRPTIPSNRDSYFVHKFNKELEAYTKCIKEYVRNAGDDIQQINQRVDAVVNDHNQFLRSIN